MSTHPVEVLFAAMADVAPYPAGVLPVDGRIPGTAFFPGGAGLWGAASDRALPPMPIGGIMVLGHDFHSAKAFHDSLRQGTEVPERPRDGYRVPRTWVELRKLFAEVGIPLERCFFTNAYMGLRAGEANTGRFPGSRDPDFVKRCQSFFLRQVRAQQPSIILALGVWTPAFLAPLSPQLGHWSGKRTMRELDQAGPLVRSVIFDGNVGSSSTVAILTHPSLRGSNVGRREYLHHRRHAAEVAMLRAVLQPSVKGAI